MRFIFGFNPPLVEAIGYGKSLHDALAEAHRRAIAGDIPTRDDVDQLIDNHLNLPFAYPTMHDTLENAAKRALANYFDRHGHNLAEAIHSEKSIEFSPRPGLVVQGRIDLVWSKRPTSSVWWISSQLHEHRWMMSRTTN